MRTKSIVDRLRKISYVDLHYLHLVKTPARPQCCVVLHFSTHVFKISELIEGGFDEL